MTLKLVKFITHHDIYMPGEVAGFPEDRAARLIAARAAVRVTEEITAAPADEGPAVREEVATVPEESTTPRRRRKP